MKKWGVFLSFAFGVLCLLAAANHFRLTGRLGPIGTVELLGGIGVILTATAQLLTETKAKLALGLRIVAGVLYVSGAVVYLLNPRGRAVGETCSGELSTCLSDTSARQCQDGIVVEVPCRGPKGCKRSGALAITCDVAVARPGERCMTTNEDKFACSDDGHAMLVCKGHRFETARECTGPKGCFVANATQIACDLEKTE